MLLPLPPWASPSPWTSGTATSPRSRFFRLSARRREHPVRTPAKNGTYLLLDVLWETASGKTNSNPFYFTAKDANGRKADQNLFADDQLGSGTVLPGDKSRGFIAFDVAPGPVTVMISDSADAGSGADADSGVARPTVSCCPPVT